MGPKKGRKKEKKKKEEPPRPTKSHYLTRIAEMNAVLAQVRRETFDIETTYFDTEKKYEQTEEDLADIISYLEHEIKICEEEITEYNVGIEKYMLEMKRQEKYYTEIFARMEEEYEEKKLQLTEKIESVNAKLNSFEEVRRQREEFVRKQAALKKLMEEMALRHKQEIYEAEKEAIIEQAKLQKEMERRLAELALNLREATDVRIGETTNRIIGENITLGNMLTCQQELLENMRSEYMHMKKILHRQTLNLELKEDEYSQVFVSHSELSEKIEGLLKAIDEMTKRIEELKKLIKVNRRLKRKIAELECLLRDLTQEHSTLLKSLEEVEEMNNNAKGNLRIFQKNVLKLQLSLFEAAKKVKEAIECEDIPSEEKDVQVENTEETFFRRETNAEDELHKDNIFKKRESLIEEIMIKLQAGVLNGDDLQLRVSSCESCDTDNNRES